MYKLPFWAQPATWLLQGSARERARAHYMNEEGPELDRALLDLDFEPGSQDHALQSLNIDHAQGLVDDRTYELRRAAILHSGVDLDIEVVGIELRYGNLTEQEAAKKVATLKQESWVGGPVVHDGEGGVIFDLDWNEYWIDELRQNGYTGSSDQEVMQKWFAALCYSEVINNGGEELDPFFEAMARETLRKLTNRD
jgi:hypothetical protein